VVAERNWRRVTVVSGTVEWAGAIQKRVLCGRRRAAAPLFREIWRGRCRRGAVDAAGAGDAVPGILVGRGDTDAAVQSMTARVEAWQPVVEQAAQRAQCEQELSEAATI